MSQVREEIFARLRATTAAHGTLDERARLVQTRISTPLRGPIPSFTEPPMTRFIAKLEQASASVKMIDDIADLPEAVDEYMLQWGIERSIVAASHALLNEPEWPRDMVIAHRAAHAEDVIALSVATAAIAETGTLVLCSGKETPTSLNFLPDNFLCVVQDADIYTCMEDIWAFIRKRDMPRSINFITGPSRTADVEQTIQLGAHGPRRLHVIILTTNKR